MKHNTATLTLAALALSTLALAAPARAQTPVFGNFSALAAANRSGTFIDSTTASSFRFTTGTTAISVNSVQVSLYRQSDTNSTVSFGIWSNASGDPGTLLFSFGNQTITNAFDAPQEYTFARGDSFPLLTNTTYHLRSSFVSGGIGVWDNTNPGIVPTAQNGSGITHQAYRVSLLNGLVIQDQPGVSRFQLNGTVAVVPEAGSLALVLPALVLVGCGVVRRKCGVK